MLKKIICIFLVLLLLSAQYLQCFALNNDDLSASCAVLYYPGQKKILFEKNAQTKRSMASTTKIMTSLLALEECTPDRQIDITWEMVNVEGTSSGLRADDTVYLKDLVYCMLLESGNDAANAVALGLCGSYEAFAEKMNARAEEIGMENTSFVTPSGLDDENHYTTAYDMALLAAEAIENKEFASICSTEKYKVEFINSDKTVTLYNHNKLLQKYSSAIGIKTGFTKKSGRCLVSAATQNGITLVAVTLNAGDDWNDHIKMFNYGFGLFEQKTADGNFSSYAVSVTGGNSAFVTAKSEDIILWSVKESDIERKIYFQKFLYAPVKEGDVIGYAEYVCGSQVVKRVQLKASHAVPVKQPQSKNIIDRIKDLLGN